LTTVRDQVALKLSLNYVCWRVAFQFVHMHEITVLCAHACRYRPISSPVDSSRPVRSMTGRSNMNSR